MMRKLIFIFFVLIFFSAKISVAQDSNNDTTVYRVVDVNPEFPGGEERMQEYIQFRLNGEQSPSYDLKEGNIVVEFIVEKNGRIRTVKVLQSLDPMFDQNFVEIFKAMPKWKPAQKNGQAVRYKIKYTWGMNYYMR